MSDPTASAAPSTSAPSADSGTSASSSAPGPVNPGASTPSSTPAAPPVQAAPSKQKFTFDIGGKQQEYEWTQEEVQARARKGLEFDRIDSEHRQLRERHTRLVEAWKKDPFNPDLNKALGIDLEALAEKRLADKYRREVEMEKLTPEQKAFREREEAFKQKEAQLEQLQKAEAERVQAQADQRVLQDLHKEWEATLQGSGLPFNKEVQYLFADIALKYENAGVRMDPRHIAAEIQERLNEGRGNLEKSVRSGLKGEALAKHLGPDVVKEIISWRMAQVRAGGKPVPVPVPQTDAPGDRAPKPKAYNSSKFFKENIL